MKNNLEKWNYYLSLLNDKTDEYINTYIINTIPNIIYCVDYDGNIIEKTINKYIYHHSGIDKYIGKKPSKKEINLLIQYIEMIEYDINNVYVYFNDNKGVIKYNNINNNSSYYSNIDDVKIESDRILQNNKDRIDFYNKHSKDVHYNYDANNYKFLGWLNNGTPQKNKDYINCINEKHRLVDVSHDRSGCENIVSCPICKIYWKYDSSG